jgi:hypothetical protein
MRGEDVLDPCLRIGVLFVRVELDVELVDLLEDRVVREQVVASREKEADEGRVRDSPSAKWS